MLHIKQTIIVEGKYDKIRLANITDANVVTTGGFDIFTDAPKRKLLKMLAEKSGIILLTDSDRAGYKIRSKIRGYLPKENVFELYIPQIEGKEQRKTEGSKDGFLGVEGVPDGVLIKLLEPFATDEEKTKTGISKSDLYEWGLLGKADSSKKRDELAKKLGLPQKMSSNALLSALDIMFSREDIERLII